MKRTATQRLVSCGLGLLLAVTAAAQGQVDLARVEQMPRFPEPYAMRDWQRVAQGYDSLVFDPHRQGTYLPLVWLEPSGRGFGLPSYVGAANPRGREAINVLPALVGAALAGVDKRAQYGHDWVPMAQAFFNPDPAQGVYLNDPGGESGSDWWYDTMPNVFFYQLFDLYRYPRPAGFDDQLRSVADRWLEAVRRMGGRATPWAVPNMDYRAWRLASMTGNADGVHEPEAAGAIAWLLYHAYVETGAPAYRMGAEWAMEFLDSRTQNPSYELQLAYGAYVAARMNAELGTDYDVEKLVRWCFDVGPLRSWGTIVGTWGGYDVSGLVGEVNGSNDYAFAMNTFEQVGALVPLVRYDERFARAIGKWVLNAANAARLFYPNALPDANQDSETWLHTYDPRGVVAYEALRESVGGRSPYATGDAIGGGWAATNLALYGASHVGILAGIVDTTDVPYVLRLDVRRTDYFSGLHAHSTYLYYNPHDEERTVTLDVGDLASFDLYDAVADRYVARGVSGRVGVPLPADGAALVVVVPAGREVVEEDGRLLVGGEVVDYHVGAPGVRPPRVKGLATPPAAVLRGSTATVYCTAEGEGLDYEWTAEAGTFEGEGAIVRWAAPEAEGTYTLACTVRDAAGAEARVELAVPVVSSTPVVDAVAAAPPLVDRGGTARLTCAAHDPATDVLTYTWTAPAGRFDGGGSERAGAAVDWTAPEAEGDYYVACRAANAAGAAAADSVRVAVRDFSAGDGQLVLYLPLDGDARDAGPLALPGSTGGGARPADDPFGRPGRALHFDGTDDVARVENAAALNFGEGVTISFWLKVLAFYNREAYVVSHGSWEQRWKLSIADGRLRWTIRTDRGVYDLDSSVRLEPRRYYHVVARYDGRDVALFLDGALDAFGAFSGKLQPSTRDLTLGQRWPGDTAFGMAGELDDLRLYDGARSLHDVRAAYAAAVAADAPELLSLPPSARLDPPFPNPFAGETVVGYEVATAGPVVVRILNVLGREVRVLVDADRPAGRHEVRWDGTDAGGRPVAAGVYVCELAAGPMRVRRTVVRVR